jgi:hypothetical protein
MIGETGSTPSVPAPSGREDHLDLLLDWALEATFPASDPVALTLQDYRPPKAIAAPPSARGP